MIIKWTEEEAKLLIDAYFRTSLTETVSGRIMMNCLFPMDDLLDLITIMIFQIKQYMNFSVSDVLK